MLKILHVALFITIIEKTKCESMFMDGVIGAGEAGADRLVLG